MMTTALRHARRNAVAYLALFVALGGTSYAAVKLGKGVVKNRNIAANAVTSDKVKDGTLKSVDFAKGQIPAGAQGSQGPKGDTGPQGPKGDKGDSGAAGLSALATLPAGQSETGVYGIGAESESAGHTDLGGVTFPIPLAADLASDHVVYTTSGSATHCSGPGHADSGYLCVYETAKAGISPSSADIRNPEAALLTPGASKHGFLLVQTSGGATPQDNYAVGSWTVTG